MRFSVLGPLEITDDAGRQIALPQARPRALLVVLSLNASHPVRTGSIADMLWGLKPPANWPGALRTHVWQIRRRLPRGRLGHDSRGYALRLERDELDLVEFRGWAARGRDARAAGRTTAAAAMLARAVSLWRDPPLADLPDTPIMATAAGELVDEWQAVDDELADLRLDLGEHQMMLAQLKARVREDPTNERAWERYITALYRSGLRAASLEAFLRMRRMLADEHGIDPGPRLRHLHDQILHDDPVLG